MTDISLPALDGRDALGFLAATGTLYLVTSRHDPDAALSWDAATGTAILTSSLESVDRLADFVINTIAATDAFGVIPGLPVDFPPRGEAPDKLRLTREDYRTYATRVTKGPFGHGGARGQANTDEEDVTGEVESWLASLITDLVVDSKEHVAISLFAAPSGKQSMRTMLEKSLEFSRKNPQVIREAFLGWRRYPGITGEYLDHRVIYDAGQAPDGKSRERGVPGATWLALMSYPMFLTTRREESVASTGWRYDPDRGRRQLVLPLWSPRLNLDAVEALLRHPALFGEGFIETAAAEALGIFGITVFERHKVGDRKFAGVLGPLRSEDANRHLRRRR